MKRGFTKVLLAIAFPPVAFGLGAGFAFLQNVAKPPGAPHVKNLLEDEVITCALGNAVACGKLGYKYLHGDGVKKSMAEASSFFNKSCKGGETSGCNHLAALLLGKSPEAAYLLFRKSCELGDARGCAATARLRYIGTGTPRSYPDAFALFRKACELKSGAGCHGLGMMYGNGHGTTKSLAKAAENFKRGCRMDWDPACKDLRRIPASVKSGKKSS